MIAASDNRVDIYLWSYLPLELKMGCNQFIGTQEHDVFWGIFHDIEQILISTR